MTQRRAQFRSKRTKGKQLAIRIRTAESSKPWEKGWLKLRGPFPANQPPPPFRSICPIDRRIQTNRWGNRRLRCRRLGSSYLYCTNTYEWPVRYGKSYLLLRTSYRDSILKNKARKQENTWTKSISPSGRGCGCQRYWLGFGGMPEKSFVSFLLPSIGLNGRWITDGRIR